MFGHFGLIIQKSRETEGYIIILIVSNNQNKKKTENVFQQVQLYNAQWQLDHVQSRFNLDVYPVNESFPNGTDSNSSTI